MRGRGPIDQVTHTTTGGDVFAAGPGGLYVFHPDGTLLARFLLSEPIASLAWDKRRAVLHMTVGHRICRLRTKVAGAVVTDELQPKPETAARQTPAEPRPEPRAAAPISGRSAPL